VRPAIRGALTVALTALLVSPAFAAGGGPTATTASTTAAPAPQQPGLSPFGPLQSQVGTDTTPTQTSVTPTKRAGDTGSGRSVLLFLSIFALVMIAGVALFIWYEGAKGSTAKAKRRRQRMRSGRPGPAAATMSAGGPPPPPRKKRAQAKRKKR
jgi:hypothetical protein